MENTREYYTEQLDLLLCSTRRPGVTDLVKYIHECGFLKAPCSGGNHMSIKGGLLLHSINVYNVAHSLNSCLDTDITEDSIILTSLLHDLGKAGDFGKPNYTPNILKNGEQSRAKPYETNKDLLPVPHEVRSVALCKQFIRLTEEEEFAILCHNGLYGDMYKVVKGNETPLYLILHMADMWASRVMED